jgi:hypothetical protein
MLSQFPCSVTSLNLVPLPEREATKVAGRVKYLSELVNRRTLEPQNVFAFALAYM